MVEVRSSSVAPVQMPADPAVGDIHNKAQVPGVNLRISLELNPPRLLLRACK